jgi:hypothetical protein
MDNPEHPLLPSLEETLKSFSAPEQERVKTAMADPAVRKFLQILNYNALADLSKNDAETPEQQAKLLMRFHKLKGILHVVNFLINSVGGIKPNA